MHPWRQTWRPDPRAPRSVLVLLAAAGVAGMLAGCTPSSEEPGTSTQDPAERADGTPPVGPLDALLDAVSQGGGETPEAELARLERNEEIIASCMAEQGFEYAPTNWRARAAAQVGGGRVAEAPVGDPVAFAAEHGYGVFTADAVAAALAPPGPAADDPNAERLAAMSQAEQEAWYLALWGPGQDEGEDAGPATYDWTTYGCGGRAAHETGTDDVAVFDDSAWQGLREEIVALADTVPTHPDLADAQVAWSACMDRAGHPGYVTVDDPVDEMVRRAEAIWAEAGQGMPVDLSADDALADPAALELQAEVEARAAEMLRVETELAVADAGCRAESGYTERAAQVWLALQEEFYAAHRVDLDAWFAAFQEFQATAG